MYSKIKKFLYPALLFSSLFLAPNRGFSYPKLEYDPPPQLKSKGKFSPLLSYRQGKASLTVYLVYATSRSKPHIDPQLKSKLPSLNKFYKFNSYFLLKRRHYLLPYRKKVNFIISQKYRVRFRVMRYIHATKRISIEAVFFRRKNKRKSVFFSYATTQLKLRDGKSVAFLGPHIRKGRSLLILTARHKPR